MPRTRMLLTIHNMDSSGEVREDEFAATGERSCGVFAAFRNIFLRQCMREDEFPATGEQRSRSLCAGMSTDLFKSVDSSQLIQIALQPFLCR